MANYNDEEKIYEKKIGTPFYGTKEDGGSASNPSENSASGIKINYGNYDIEPNRNYMTDVIKSAKKGDYNAAAYYERMRNAKIDAGLGGPYQPTYDFNYKSKYDDKISDIRSQLENYEDFSYDLESDDNFKALANVYHKNAQAAQKNALAQAAAMNGGRLSSNALIAASLGYGNQMSELEAEIPQLRQAAYNMYLNDKNELRNTMNDYIQAEADNYSKWTDGFNRRYGITRDNIEDSQWQQTYELNAKNVDAQIDSLMKNDAMQASLMMGKVTPEAAKLLGVEEGTSIYDALKEYRDNQIELALARGYIDYDLAASYGFPYASPTVSMIGTDKFSANGSSGIFGNPFLTGNPSDNTSMQTTDLTGENGQNHNATITMRNGVVSYSPTAGVMPTDNPQIHTTPNPYPWAQKNTVDPLTGNSGTINYKTNTGAGGSSGGSGVNYGTGSGGGGNTNTDTNNEYQNSGNHDAQTVQYYTNMVNNSDYDDPFEAVDALVPDYLKEDVMNNMAK